MPEQLRDRYKLRVLGKNAMEKRALFLEETRNALLSTPWWKVKTIDICREVACAQSSFYQYWEDLEHAVHEVISNEIASLKDGESLPKRLDLIKQMMEDWGWRF